MPNTYFSFKEFTVHQDACAMKVSSDACLLGAWCAEEIAKDKDGEQLLDIGTGTGLLSLMVAQKKAIVIDAVEMDAAAAEQARQNIKESNFKNIHIIQKDILNFPVTGYDYIISNPPFYESELSSPSQGRSAAHHGASLRWEHLFQIISKKLTPEGCFFLLLPYKRLNELPNYLLQNKLYLQQKIAVRHSADRAPTRLLIKGLKTEGDVKEEDWAIKEGTEYSPIFKRLLKDYYLAL